LEEERLDFERQIHVMLVNVEAAYWNLYSSYWALYSREQALRQAFEAWKINKARYEAGRISIEDFAQTRGQFELFRGQRLAALDDVLEREHQLRALIGMAVEDGSRLVPIDTPTLTPYEPDWATALNECLALRPGLGQARQDLKFRQLDLINQKNLLQPDLRFASTIAPNGLGSTLDGSKSSVLPPSALNPNAVRVPANALHTLGTGITSIGVSCCAWTWPWAIATRMPPSDRRGCLWLKAISAFGIPRDGTRSFWSSSIERSSRRTRKSSPSGLSGKRPLNNWRLATSSFKRAKAHWTSCWKLSACGRTPFAPSTKPLLTITMRWPGSNTPRARSCSATTSSSRKAACRNALRSERSSMNGSAAAPWC